MGMCQMALGEEGVININQPLIENQGAQQKTYKQDFEERVTVLASQPLRVIACAYAELQEQDWA